MLYKIVKLKSGEIKRAPIDKYTDDEIREKFKDDLLNIIIVNLEKKENKQRLFWKIRLSFNNENDNVWIEEDELLKARYCFLYDKKANFKHSAFKGAFIISIMPDYGYSLGLNRGIEPNGEDWREIERKGIKKLLDDKTEASKVACSGIKTFKEAVFKYKELGGEVSDEDIRLLGLESKLLN